MADHGVVPPPSLTYAVAGDSAAYVNGAVPIGRVYEVHAYVHPDGTLYVYVAGALLRKDGTLGRHRRTTTVDLSRLLPNWLDPIVNDARRRLGVDLG